MISVRPFRGFVVRREFAAEVTCPPYDVMNREEALALAAGKPRSFLHVIRSEIDFEPTVAPYSERVYNRAAENLTTAVKGGVFTQEETPCTFAYRLIMDGHTQIGLVALFSVADYDEGKIKIHEKTRPEKEDDRVRHIGRTRAHCEPVLLTYRDVPAITQQLLAETNSEPICDYTSDDNVRHTLWRISDSAGLLKNCCELPALYIADGHHRAKSASRVFADLSKASDGKSAEGAGYFLAVAFPHNQLRILPYNRIIYRSPVATDQLLSALSQSFTVSKNSAPTPSAPGEISCYLAGTWHGLKLKAKLGASQDPVSRLDVSVLFETVLRPIFGIENERTDKNIDFVGGIRGTKELEKLVDSGKAVCAFSMYPVSVETVLDVADQGLIMAPKSTWFEPKLRSGFIFHRFESSF